MLLLLQRLPAAWRLGPRVGPSELALPAVLPPGTGPGLAPPAPRVPAVPSAGALHGRGSSTHPSLLSFFSIPQNTVLFNNSADLGGGIYVKEAGLTVQNCTFDWNHAGAGVSGLSCSF